MTTITKTTATLVEKEAISKLTFAKIEVLGSDAKRAEIVSRIKKAKKLGNSFKSKVKIIFEDTTGLKKVETTIWGVTEKNVILKKNTLIPIRCIHEIKFY